MKSLIFPLYYLQKKKKKGLNDTINVKKMLSWKKRKTAFLHFLIYSF